MKKRNLFGIGAKLVLAALAFSSVTLTGCYRDEGLDVQTPTLTVPYTTTYTVSGVILDAVTQEPVAATVEITGAISFSASNVTSYSATTTTPGTVTIKVTPADATYAAQTRTFEITSITNGAVVYPQNFYLVGTVTNEVVKYNLSVKAFDATTNDEIDLTNATVTYNPSDTEVEGGTAVTIAISDVDGYQAKTIVENLPKTYVPVGSDAVDYVVAVYLSAETVEGLIAVQFFDFNTNSNVEVEEAVLYKDDKSVYVIRNAKWFSYTDPNYDENAEYTVVITYDGEEYPAAKVIPTEGGSVKMWLNGAIAEPGTIVSIVDANGNAFVDEDGEEYEDNIIFPEDFVASDEDGNGVPSVEIINVTAEEKAEEGEEEEVVLRAFEGRPDGTTFEPALQIVFADPYDGELGDLDLLYEENEEWVEDGGSVALDGAKYFISVPHFSRFKVAVPLNTETANEEGTEATELEGYWVENLHSGAQNFTVSYTYKTGSEFVEPIEDAVKAAGFTSEKAIKELVKAITKVLAEEGIGGAEAEVVEGTETISAPAGVRLENFAVSQVVTNYTYTYTINGKAITVKVAKYGAASLTFDEADLTHAHGHSHGDNWNAGGGITSAE